jgi:drug/metabolite transporter (DMT)-like permease
LRQLHYGQDSEIAAPLYIWGTTLAVVASIGGALAWTFAAQRVPVALSAQLITMETIFGTVLGLLIRRRWPTIAESAGMTVLIVGVVMGIRIFHGRKSISLQRHAASRATPAGSAPTFEDSRVSG